VENAPVEGVGRETDAVSTVVLVEDDPEIVALLGDFLAVEDFGVLSAPGVGGAIAALGTHAIASGWWRRSPRPPPPGSARGPWPATGRPRARTTVTAVKPVDLTPAATGQLKALKSSGEGFVTPGFKAMSQVADFKQNLLDDYRSQSVSGAGIEGTVFVARESAAVRWAVTLGSGALHSQSCPSPHVPGRSRRWATR
jgi:hypothetical protein